MTRLLANIRYAQRNDCDKSFGIPGTRVKVDLDRCFASEIGHVANGLGKKFVGVNVTRS